MNITDNGYTLVYLPRGARVAHVLPPNHSPNGGGVAVCSRMPNWPDTWHGTGNQDEWEKARLLPTCIGCAAWLRRNGPDREK